MRRTTGIVAVITLLAAFTSATTRASGVSAPATAITTPKGSVVVSTGSINVTGTATDAVTGVQIYCTFNRETAYSGPLNAATIPVIGGHFAGTILTGDLPGQGCRLRAVPAGPLPTYWAPFTGPTLYAYATFDSADGVSGNLTERDLQFSGPNGFGLLSQPDSEALQLAPAQPAGQDGSPQLLENAGFFTLANNNATAGGLIVDGHYAYTPAELVDDVTPTDSVNYSFVPLVATASFGSTPGVASLSSVIPLYRCSGANAVTVTAVNCPSVVRLPVTLVARASAGNGGATVSQSLMFAGTDSHAHTVTVNLRTAIVDDTSNTPAFRYPNGTSAFHFTSTGTAVAGIKAGPPTMVIKRDGYATDGDPDSAVGTDTESSQPTKLGFVSNAEYGADYTRKIPAKGEAGVTMVYTGGISLATVEAVAKATAHALLGSIKITSPRHTESTNSHHLAVTVKVTAGGNGLPTAVTINGKKATRGTHSATTATYHATVTLKKGAHPIVAAATDPGGVRFSAKRTVDVV